MSIDPKLAKLAEEAEKKDELDVPLAIQFAQYVRDEMSKIESGITDQMKRIERQIADQVGAAVQANAATVMRMEELENRFEDLKTDLQHRAHERAELDVVEAEARYLIAQRRKDGLSTQEKIDVGKMLEDREAAARRARAERWSKLWEKVVPNVVTGLALMVLGPLFLAFVVAVLVFALRALGVEVTLPT